MMVKLSSLPGVKTVKSFGELIKHVTSEMKKIHEVAHANVLKKGTHLKPKAGK